jgi:4-coumarate--CoA ligase
MAVKTSLLVVHPVIVDTALKAAKKANLPANRVLLLVSDAVQAACISVEYLINEGLNKVAGFTERRLAPGEARKKLAFLCF